MTQVIELINKDIQAVMIVFLMFKKLEERLNVLSRDIEDIKRRPKLKIQKMKIAMAQTTSIPDEIISRINIAEDTEED